MTGADDTTCIDELVSAARAAQQRYEQNGSQELFDRACQAVAWVLMEPARNEQLSKMAVAETGLGNVADKIRKTTTKPQPDARFKMYKALVTSVMMRQKACQLITAEKHCGYCAFNNPLHTSHNIINALKTGNAIIIAPSPKGVKPANILLATSMMLWPSLGCLLNCPDGTYRRAKDTAADAAG